MLEVVQTFAGIALSLQLAERFMRLWLPVRAAVTVVCRIEWDSLTHSKRTLAGESVRDWFAADFPNFPLTPVRLLPKSNGGGTHMNRLLPASVAEIKTRFPVVGARSAIEAITITAI